MLLKYGLQSKFNLWIYICTYDYGLLFWFLKLKTVRNEMMIVINVHDLLVHTYIIQFQTAE